MTPAQRRLYGDVCMMLLLGIMVTGLIGAYLGVIP